MDFKDMENNGDHTGCLESLIEVFLYIDGQLDEQRERDIERHLEHCAQCYGRVAFHRTLKEYVKNKGINETVSPFFLSKVNDIINKR